MADAEPLRWEQHYRHNWNAVVVQM